QQRHRGHQTERRAVHRHRDARREQVGLLRRVDGGDRREGADEAHDRAEQSEQRREVGEGREVVRALLELRHYLHQALFHRLLDVIAAPRRLNAREPVIENVGNRRVGLRGRRRDLTKVALREQRHYLVPQRAVTRRYLRKIDVAFDGDRQTDHEHERDRVHEVPAALKEPYDQVPEAHLTLPLSVTT